MAYKVIPQVEFDKSVQQIMSTGLGRTPAENIVLAFWKASIDLNKNFKKLIESAVATGKLEVSQEVLNHINSNLPETINYYVKTTSTITPIALREL
jgi:hypothetical protein